jgi:hypothetical protein
MSVKGPQDRHEKFDLAIIPKKIMSQKIEDIVKGLNAN